MPALLAILGGALLLVWPALLNGYPILFSDTGGLLDMGLAGDMGWDKPWVYGPFLALTSAGLTLWGSVAAQGLLLSHLLWLTQSVMAPPRPGRHLSLCAVLAAATAAPWFAALLMPDTFAPLVVLSLFVLAFGPGRVSRGALAWAGVVGTVAVASHLAHLVLAAGVVATAGLLRRRLPWRPALPVAAALGFLLCSNLVGNGVLAVSPYGSVFALARLVGDGPGRAYVDAACPAAGWRICAWQGRLPADSDEFLWHPNGPVWADGFGPIRYAPEAARLVPAIIAAHPGAVLQAAAANTLRQLGLVRVGDTLVADHLDVALLPRLNQYFPPQEAAAFRASLQAAGRLPAAAAPFNTLHLAMLAAGAVGTIWIALGLALARRSPASTILTLRGEEQSLTEHCGDRDLIGHGGDRSLAPHHGERSLLRHCEERSDAAIQGPYAPALAAGAPWTATPQPARNDGRTRAPRAGKNTRLAQDRRTTAFDRLRAIASNPLQALAVLILAGLLANAAATGALSGPHHRYQARIAWLVVLPPLLAYAARRDASCRDTSAGAMWTSAS